MEKTRDQVETQYKWKVEDIYPDIKVWEEDYKVVSSMLPKLKEYQDTFLLSARNLYDFLKYDEKVSIKLENLYTYAHLNSDTDKGSSIYQELYGKAMNLLSEYDSETAFVKPALLKEEYRKIERFIKELPELKEYEVILKRIFRYQNHTLSKSEETLLAMYGKVLNSSSDIAEIVKENDMSFGTIEDEDGNEVTLNNSNYSIYISSKMRKVRKQAFGTLYKGYAQFATTLAKTLSSTIEEYAVTAKVKHYPSSLAMALYDDDVDVKIYDKLIATTKKNLPVLFDYYKMKKDLLKLDELHLYDIYTPIVGESEKEYTFDEAKKIVLDTLSIFGEDYQETAKKAFTEGWIDIYPNKGKISGAYSGGCYTTKPYMLLNFNGKLHDVSTLIHELGHSMHSYYTRKNNPYSTGNYSIFVAEVASTVNELLLNKHLLKTLTDKQERLVVLNNMLELFKATIFRQVMFAEFEKKIHEEVEDGNVLTKDNLCDIYYQLNKEYFGEDVIVDKEIQYEWERIDHFYMIFYVYQYATGLSAACKIVTDLLEGKPSTCENYLAFLKSGSTKQPIEALKIAGVDMNDASVFTSAIRMFEDTLNEFKREIDS